MEIMSNHLVRVKSNREWKVLVVDYDRVCLTILEKMLRTACNYHVSISNNAKDATSLLKDQNNNFDFVIIDVYVPHMDGLEFLKQICEQIDIPVIAMSSYADEDLIKGVFKAGACDCLVKPIRLENVRHIWINVYRAQSNGAIKRVEQSRSNSVTELINNDQSNNNPGDYGKTNDTIKSKNSDGEESKFVKKKKKLISTNDVGDNQQINDDASTKKKKPRIIWTPELHEKFVAAVKQFGNSKAVPKKILELMNVPGLTRENVASHLQKYRQCHKQLERPFLRKRGNKVKLIPLQEQSHISISPTNGHPNIQTQTQVISTSSLQVRSFPTQIDLYGNHETLKHMTHAMKIQAMSNESMVFGENSSSKTDMNMAIVKHVEGSNVIYHPWSTTFSMEDNVNKEATSFFAREQCVNYGYGYENLLDLGYNDAPFCFEQIDHNSYAH